MPNVDNKLKILSNYGPGVVSAI